MNSIATSSRTDTLDRLRRQLDEADRELTELLARRLNLCDEIGEIKRAAAMPMMQPQRIAHVKQRCAEFGALLGLDRTFVESLYGLIIDEACRREDRIIGHSTHDSCAGAPALRFATLGPLGTCHEYATQRYIDFHELPGSRIIPLVGFADAIPLLRSGEVDYVVQNSAHPDVYLLTEKHHTEIFVVDSFVCPTKPMGLLRRREVTNPRSVGLMPATKGYFDVSEFAEVTFETANPIVGHGLLAGKYDAGFTFLEFAEAHPEELEVVKAIGVVDTAWLVYGTRRRANGAVLATRDATWIRR